MVAANV